MKKHSTSTMPAIMAVMLPGPTSVADELAADAVVPYLGHYHFVGGAAEIAAFDEAIEAALFRMNPLLRLLARRRLRKPNLPSAGLVVRFEGSLLVVSRPGEPTVSAPANGATVSWTSPRGARFQVRQGIDGETLYQRFEGERSLQINRLHLQPDGRALFVDSHVDARGLPAPLVYRFTYERD